MSEPEAPADVCFAFVDALIVDDFDAAWACLEPDTQRAISKGYPTLVVGVEFTAKSRRVFTHFLEWRREGRLVVLPGSADSIPAPFLEDVILAEEGAADGPQLGFEVHLTDRWRIVGFEQNDA